ncbi:MAG: ABC transporter permease [Gammaproteobacteria bacterium]|nr:ABC transporter permease [Gammaproteobacteria bacterium]
MDRSPNIYAGDAMTLTDTLNYTLTTFRAHRLRLSLMLLATAIGVASVVILTSLGEGARNYVINEFSSMGTNLIIVFPGKAETTGALPPVVGEAPNDLTIEDAMALKRIPGITHIAPINVGSAPIDWRRRERETTIFGSNHALAAIQDIELAEGEFLPDIDPRKTSPVAVIGAKIREELFGTQPALGEWIRIENYRFRVIGVTRSAGTAMGINRDEIVIIPVASAQQLFNTPSLFRILIHTRNRENIEQVRDDTVALITKRHDGEEDVTVITQDAVLNAFDRILGALTMSVAGIASVSLLVAGVLIMNVMLISVSQRRAEIGLLKAVGASSRQILWLFISEAALLSLLGGLIGIALGIGVSELLAQLYPTLPIAPPGWVIGAALGICLGSGILFGVLPAKHAAQLDPVTALARR